MTTENKTIEIDGKSFELVSHCAHGEDGYLLKPVPSADEKWVPRKGCCFYSITWKGQMGEFIWSGGRTDSALLAVGNIFRTKEEAKASVIYAAFHGQAVALPEDGYCYYSPLFSLADKPDNSVEVEGYNAAINKWRAVIPDWNLNVIYRWPKQKEGGE